jgi:hypothetical protein
MEVGECDGKVISLHHRLKNYDATHQILTDFVSLIFILFQDIYRNIFIDVYVFGNNK